MTGGKRPSLVLIHGGPESQYLPNFRTEVQFLIARGYAVLATNVFRLQDGQWKLILHHGSPFVPEPVPKQPELPAKKLVN